MRFTIFSIFPEFFASPLATSLLGKAIAAQVLDVRLVDFRAFATDKHRSVDDVPYGGGPGMVLKPEPIVAAMEAHPPMAGGLRLYVTPWGEPLTQARVESLASLPEVQILCGRYEGVDERVIEGWIDLTVSVGDFVLAGGEAAAVCLIEAVSRFVPGVLGDAQSLHDESFRDGRLEGPQYTRPPEFRGRAVPSVLLQGNHAAIAAWRRDQALLRTRRVRPDLLREGAAGDDAPGPARTETTE